MSSDKETHSVEEIECYIRYFYWMLHRVFRLNVISVVQWRIEKKRLFFEFNVPEYHTAEIFPDERVYIKVPF